jgi:hypothetical protein
MKQVLFVALALFILNSSAQEATNVLDRISAALPVYFDAHPLEKVYVHTDKEIYAPGEIIWFRAWITDRASFDFGNLSPDVNVNIYNADGQFITGDKFLISGGRVNGDMKLPAVLSTGRYYLTASTPLQLKPEEAFIKPIIIDQAYEQEALVALARPEMVYPAGTEVTIDLLVKDYYGQAVDRYNFDYSITHGSQSLGSGKLRSSGGAASIRVKIPENTGTQPIELNLSHPRNLWSEKHNLLTEADKLDLKFYPEGGNLMDNIPVKMGFYATVQGSRPVDIEADILDAEGQIVTKATTFLPGFGFFPFRAEPGKKYSLVVTGSYGKGQRFELPMQNNGKVALSVTRADEGFLNADIVAPDQKPRQLAVVVTENFNMIWAANFEVTKSARVRIPTLDFDPGIQLISVFDQEGSLLASRMVYTPVKNRINTRVFSEVVDNQVKITVQSKDSDGKPALTNLMVSVADKARVTDIRNSFESYFPFASELKNTIAYPAGLFETESNMTTAIDYILIANEPKCFSWDNILNHEKGEASTFLEQKGIRGQVVTRRGDPVSGAKISLLNSRDMQMYSATADDQGNFIFPSLNPVDLSDYTITATDERGRGVLTVQLEPAFSDQIGTAIKKWDPLYYSLNKFSSQSPAYYLANPGFIVKAPAIVRTPAATTTGKPRSDSYKSLLQTATSLLEVIKMMKPYQLMGGQIVFYGTQNSFYHQSGALIVVDGQKMGTSADILSMIPPNDVESINISLDPMDIQKYTGLNNVGIIEINTKKGDYNKVPVSQLPAPEMIYQDGYRVPRSFLSTDGIRYGSGKDLRTTLFWSPTLELNRDGSATFAIPLSEVKSEYVISVEGMDNEGRFSKATSVFTVK